MELKAIASYFDTIAFDVYVPGALSGTWTENAFVGQIKTADQFLSMWNRATRRRMLMTAPEQEPSKPVIRVNGDSEVFLLGTGQRDMMDQIHYRSTFNIQYARGVAVVKRFSVSGPASNPGWETEQTIQTTYGDIELRTQIEDRNTEYNHFSNYYLVLPSDCQVVDGDYVELAGDTYFVEEPYFDAGYLFCRVNDQPNTRENAVYRHRTGSGFNTTTMAPAPTYNNYNVTIKVTEVATELDHRMSPDDIDMTLVVQKKNFPNTFRPGPDDLFEIGGDSYRVIASRETGDRLEWRIMVRK